MWVYSYRRNFFQSSDPFRTWCGDDIAGLLTVCLPRATLDDTSFVCSLDSTPSAYFSFLSMVEASKLVPLAWASTNICAWLAAATKPPLCYTEGKQRRWSFQLESNVGRIMNNWAWEPYLAQNRCNNEHWKNLEQIMHMRAGIDLVPRSGCLSPLT